MGIIRNDKIENAEKGCGFYAGVDTRSGNVEVFLLSDAKQNQGKGSCFCDEYLGTISLKNIDSISLDAEYAISMWKKILAQVRQERQPCYDCQLHLKK